MNVKYLCVKPVVLFPNVQVTVNVMLQPAVWTVRVTGHCNPQVTGHNFTL